ncbi:MAG: hypothetical protein Kow0068_19170 [Marinilabiliales bacterium]
MLASAIYNDLDSQVKIPWYAHPTLNYISSAENVYPVIGTANDYSMHFFTNSQYRMIITNDKGYLGIGLPIPNNYTNASNYPQSKLHVHSDEYINVSSGFSPGTSTGGNLPDFSLSNLSFLNNSFKGFNISQNNLLPYTGIQITNDATGIEFQDGLHVGVIDNNAFIKLKETGSISFQNSGKTSMQITEDNNINIGSVSTPEAKLTVFTNTNNGLLVTSANNTNGYIIKARATNHPDAFVVNADGNVGIGTTDPQAKLSIVGTLSTANKLIDLQQGYAIYSDNVGSGIGGNSRLWFDASNNGSMVFGPRAGDSLLNNIRIRARQTSFEGSISVGNKCRIHASTGYIWAQEVTVSISSPYAYPDFVFQPDYELPSIEYVKNYIKKNGHLPNVPSAEDINKNNGIDLGKMNTILLKKIEELTLYVIELKTEIDQLKKCEK